MVSYTIEDVLELILAEAGEKEIDALTKVTVVLETVFVPLVIPDEDGQWSLVGWDRGAGSWKLNYAWERKEYHLSFMSPDNSVIVLPDTRNDNYDEIHLLADELNNALGRPWPFMVEQCE